MGAPLAAANPGAGALELLALRRSTPIKLLGGPGPSPSQTDAILRLAARVPDHRRLEPWRFIVFEADARRRFSEKLAEIHAHEDPSADASCLEEDKTRLLRAPVCIAVISSPDVNHKTPVWEQELSTGAVCMNLLIAANAMGWAACWLSEWCAFSQGVNNALNLTDQERVAGFMYIGTAQCPPPERPRPNVQAKTTRWS